MPVRTIAFGFVLGLFLAAKLGLFHLPPFF